MAWEPEYPRLGIHKRLMQAYTGAMPRDNDITTELALDQDSITNGNIHFSPSTCPGPVAISQSAPSYDFKGQI